MQRSALVVTPFAGDCKRHPKALLSKRRADCAPPLIADVRWRGEMPVKVYVEDENHAEVAWLCDDMWNLPEQVEALVAWLQQYHSTLDRGRYVADIGFSPRPDAAGGGAAISPEMLRTMGEVGMSLLLSEYPPFIESDDRAT